MAHLAHYRQAHPVPFIVTHWINLVCMFLLILTGILIHYPFLPALLGLARGVHIFCGMIVFANLLVRIVLAFFVKSAPTGGTREVVMDYKTWLPQADNRHMFAEWVKYYFFIQKEHPLSAKLGNPQKAAYLCVPVLILIMFITGLCLWQTTGTLPFFEGITRVLGGLMSVRIIHFMFMFVIICFIFIHLYLANIEGFEPTKLMLFGKEHGGLVYDPKRHVIIGEDDLSETKKH